MPPIHTTVWTICPLPLLTCGHPRRAYYSEASGPGWYRLGRSGSQLRITARLRNGPFSPQASFGICSLQPEPNSCTSNGLKGSQRLHFSPNLSSIIRGMKTKMVWSVEPSTWYIPKCFAGIVSESRHSQHNTTTRQGDK
ncbi:unnamed protein product [Protopolystoma xenopodis]|uniref:Uncharacterized protein n=1 Tax=Protopolystoma xenopodis TaxID=117903 RepID=A0A3S5BHU2_9PLAT|nr:unnamed protein product [Protopolystoma xenopodis]